jgi:hypothetical protein
MESGARDYNSSRSPALKCSLRDTAGELPVIPLEVSRMKRLLAIPLVLLALGLPLVAGAVLDRNFVPPGTEIRVRTDGPVIVANWDRGRIYTAHLATDVWGDNRDVAIPRGANCEIIVRQVAPGQLALDLESLTVEGRRYVMDAVGPQFNMTQDQYNSGAGIIGNIIGAITGTQGQNVQYQGDRIRVPAGSEITFRLQQPLRIANWNDEGYSDRGNHYHHDTNHGWYR